MQRGIMATPPSKYKVELHLGNEIGVNCKILGYERNFSTKNIRGSMDLRNESYYKWQR